MKLFVGTVPTNKKLFVGTVYCNEKMLKRIFSHVWKCGSTSYKISFEVSAQLKLNDSLSCFIDYFMC